MGEGSDREKRVAHYNGERRPKHEPFPVVVRYDKYRTPFDIVPYVKQALRVVPANYLQDIEEIVLRDSAGLNRERRRQKTRSRKKKVYTHTCRGLYQNGQIEIFVDNILRDRSHDRGPGFRRMDLLALFETIYHEIGHHIHESKLREYGKRETVAERYQDLYLGKYLKRYGILLALDGVLVMFRMLLKLPRIMVDPEKRTVFFRWIRRLPGRIKRIGSG